VASLHSLFLKPSLKCNARCNHCEPRRLFYRGRGGHTLSLDDYRTIIGEARTLGAGSLHLSGGEPTLYSNLSELVREGHRLNMYTVLNTNGSLITKGYAAELLEAGLSSVIVSVHSHLAEKHDAIRRRKGNFDEVTGALRIFRELRDDFYPGFIISTQTIVSKSNYTDLPGVIDLVCRLDVDAHGFSYIEGDFELAYTLDMDDIAVLKSSVIPRIASRLKNHKFKNVMLKYAALGLVSKLYGGSPARQKLMSRGIYNEKKENINCRTPRGYMMVLADGSVLPCNMVEYTDGPVLGNVHERSLREIFVSSGWRDFIRNGYECCRYCPTHYHFHIPISTSLKKILPLAVKNPAYEQKSVIARFREAL
jgi:radical SAM protein with 4Fe4S-binding SPASM domain